MGPMGLMGPMGDYDFIRPIRPMCLIGPIAMSRSSRFTSA